MSAIVQMIRELVKAGLSGDALLAAIDRVQAAGRRGTEISHAPDAHNSGPGRPRKPPAEQHPDILRAINYFGAQHQLAEAAGCAQQLISQMLNFKLPVSSESAMAIERATGGAVTRSQLRPDLWPEDEPK